MIYWALFYQNVIAGQAALSREFDKARRLARHGVLIFGRQLQPLFFGGCELCGCLAALLITQLSALVIGWMRTARLFALVTLADIVHKG